MELLFARCTILQAARSAGIQAFDTVYSGANNDAGFLQEERCVVSLNGTMIDSPVIERARLMLSRAQLSGIREE